MLIIDDRLTFDVLTDFYGWLPSGHDPDELATTTGFYYRLHLATVQDTPRAVQGVHTRAFHALPADEQVRVRARLLNPAPHVTILDPRPSLRSAASIAVQLGRTSQLQAELLGAAVHHHAALALTAWSDRLVQACDTYGIELHRITSPV